MSCLMNTRNTHTHTMQHATRGALSRFVTCSPIHRRASESHYPHHTHKQEIITMAAPRTRLGRLQDTAIFLRTLNANMLNFHRRTHLNPQYDHAQHHHTRSLACSHLSASGKQNIDVKTIRPLDHEAEKSILKQVRNGGLSSTPSLNQRSIPLPLFRAALPLRSHIIAHSSVHSPVFVWNTTLSS
jgi:hypothetical protein